VFSGGMILPPEPRHIDAIAGFIKDSYKQVESLTGIHFGQDFLWHIFNPDLSDWFPDSEKPAIALSVFKDYHFDQQLLFATDLSYSLNMEGRDLCDDEAYRHLLEKYQLPETEFYEKLHSKEYKEKASYEFALVKQLQVKGYPTVLLQVSDSKFYILTHGYSDYETMEHRLKSVLAEIEQHSS
jgi:putative protein-disulfide isomerase